MGFKLPNKVYTVGFAEDHELHGAEIKLPLMSVNTFNAILDSRTADDYANILASAIISWNLEDEDGKPLAVTVENLTSKFEIIVVSEIASNWINAAKGKSEDLKKD